MRYAASYAAELGTLLVVLALSPTAAAHWPDGFFADLSTRDETARDHLGDSVIAGLMPHRVEVRYDSRLPTKFLPPPPEDIRWQIGIRFGPYRRSEPRVPQPGDLPPKPGECLGEYMSAVLLPPRYPSPPGPRLPALSVPQPPLHEW